MDCIIKMKKLIFIYNADTGLFNTVSDFAHKIVSPSTYACSLCQITYGNFGMKKEWREFLKKVPYEMEFLHKDEALKKYPTLNETFPSILLSEKNEEFDVIMNSSALENQENLKTLIESVSIKLGV